MLAIEILKKKTFEKPYFALAKTVETINTEVDNFPYNGFFKGDYTKTEPTMFKRKAGYMPLNKCHSPIFVNNSIPLDNNMTTFFQYPLNTIFPMYPEQDEKSIKYKNSQINKCINKKL